jgi:hypothetical protein
MRNQQQLKEYIAQHPGWTIRRMQKALQKSGTTLDHLRSALSDQPPIHATARTVGQPIANLIGQFDDVAKVAKAMKELPKDSYLEDDEMRRQLSINPDRWKAVCHHPSLVAFRYALPRGNKHVWMHQAAQAKLAAAINLDQT